MINHLGGLPMSPIRQQLLDTIEQAPEAELTEILHLLQSRHPIPQPKIDSSTQAWNTVVDRLNNLTPEQRTHQRQTVSRLLQSWDETSDEDEENWEELKTSLDRNRNSYRPLFP
jgi:hypothetical protein